MAARRSFQTAGDNTPAMRPVERLPLRERQNERFGQQQLLSANKPISSKSPFKKKPGVKADPCDVISLMIKHGPMAEELPFCPPLCRASPGLAPLGTAKLAKENAVAVLAEEEESVFEQGLPDSFISEVMEKDTERRFGTCSRTVTTQSEHVREIAGTVRIGYEGEGTDTASALDQSISVGSLSGKSTNGVAQTVTDAPAVEHRVDGRDADVTFKSFSCSGLDLEIASVSLQPEESVLLLPEGPPVVSGCCSFQEECSDGLGFPQPADHRSRGNHEDHAYCLLEREDSSSRGDVIPGRASDMDSTQQEDPPDLVDQSGQALLWTSGCSVGLVAGRLLHSPPENVVFSSVAMQQDRAAQGFAPDQSHNKTETSITADQSFGFVHPDQSQLTEATDVTADQSGGFAAQCLIGYQQSYDTAEIGLLADQSLASVEMSVADDQSLGNSQMSVAADQSQGVKVKNLSIADQSRITMLQSLGDEQSQTAEVCGVAADKGKPCALSLMGVSEFSTGHVQEKLSEGTSRDVSTGHAQEKPSEDTSCDVTTGHAQEKPSESTSCDVSTEHAQEKHSESNPSDVTTGHAQEKPYEDTFFDVTTGHAQEKHSEANPSDVSTEHAQEKPSEDTSSDVITEHAQEKPSESTTADGTTGHAQEKPSEDTPSDVTTGHAQNKPSESNSSDVTTGHAQEKPSESTSSDVTTGHAQEKPSESTISDVTTGHAQEKLSEDTSSDVITGHAQEKHCESTSSVTTGHAQEKSSEDTSADVTTGHAQEKPESTSSDLSTGHAQEKPESTPSDVTTGHAQEKPSESTPSDVITGHAQKRRSDVISGNAQKRRFEVASCVAARTPALVRTSHLMEPGPGCLWDAGDSPLGPLKSRLWMGNLESPMPQPQLNSTLIISVPNFAAAAPRIAQPETEALPAPTEGSAGPSVAPLQENLGPQAPGDLPGAQLGALKVNLGPKANADSQSGPVQEKSRGLQVPGDLTVSQLGPPEKLRPLQTPGGRADARSGPLKVNLRQMGELLLRASQNLVSPVECHSAATLTSPVQRVEHGVNTSGCYERKREPSVAEACTNTDTLPWSVAPELMAGWSRQDLEQRLFSSLIMVEALSQQLASARTHRPPCAPPSETRERAAQTHHTELGQGVLYRELYVRAQERLQELDLQGDELKRLAQQLRNGCTSLTALAAETERALSSVNEMGQMANDDQHRLSQQLSQVRALYGRFWEVLKRSNERVQSCHQEKLLMEQQRDEGLRTRDAALAVLEQLQTRHAAQVCELEKSLGSHLELIPALSDACREQGLLKEECAHSLQAADDLLQHTLRDQAWLSDELRKAHSLLRRTGPVLLKLHEKAAVARQVQNQLEQDSEWMRDELDQTSSHLHEAQKQIGDLNLQITILTSEMGVLRQRLSEEEEYRSRTEMKNTELSAELSSTQTSCSLLQQALSTQTHRLEEVESSLSRRVEELGGALADRDSQLALSQRLLQELQSQLSNVREINEFLQMESQVSREQMAHSEGLVKSHLQSLRERNLECEDLKRELYALQQQRNSLQEELRSTQETAQRHLQEMERRLSMASSEITLLHHKVYTLTSALNTSLNTTHSSQKPDRPTFTVPPINSAPPRHTARSFVDSVMVAVSAEEPQASETDECLAAALGSGNSAFTRVPAAAPKMQDTVEESDVLEQLTGLGRAVSQLVCKVVCVREQRDRQCEDLRLAVSSQQEALDSQATRHRLEVAELKEQVSRLQAQVEESTTAQLQKVQEERSFRKLCRDLDESKELVQQQKLENKELRREVSELRWSLLQAQSELQLLREELSDGQATERLHPLQERLRLQQEVEKLRSRLKESEESRSKLLERAKRHQVVLEGNQRQLEKELYILDQTIRTVKQSLRSIPDVVKGCQQLEDLVTYLE